VTPFCGRESIVEILNSYYGSTRLLKYSESDDEIRFQVPAPIRDRQTAVFRSRAAVLNELAVSHRLSLLVGRGKYGVPEDCAFAIKSVETAVHSVDVVDECNVSLRFEVITKRHDTITALRSTLVTEHGVEARMTITSFNVLPPSLANFVRRARQFSDFADVKISRDKSYLATVADNHFRYDPSEDDRLSDGRRVDHVPALTLIDIALFVNRMAYQGAICSKISAEFLNYTDPRLAFDIVQKKDHSAMEFVQNGQLVAIVYITANVPVPLREAEMKQKFSLS
jgi:hypothetical protein